VSECQYYEFLALDKPLTDKQRAELRKLSSRAEITATRFVNEYHYGDFRGSPDNGHRLIPPILLPLSGRRRTATPAAVSNARLRWRPTSRRISFQAHVVSCFCHGSH